MREAFSCEATSQTIVRLPSAAARCPSATATVVLPTPPLPVTMTSRLSRSSGIGQFLAISGAGRKSGRPYEYPRNGISKPQAQTRPYPDRRAATDRRGAAPHGGGRARALARGPSRGGALLVLASCGARATPH